MFGINKCFGGPNWGVIAIVNDYVLAKLAVEKLKEKGGMYTVKVMFVIGDNAFLEEFLDIELND